MPSNPHERARRLLDQSMVEGVPPSDKCWLDSHMSQCAECGRHAELSQRAIRALGQFGFPVDPAVAMRVDEVIRERTSRMAPAGSPARVAWVANLAAFLLTIVGSMAMWQATAWAAGRWHLSAPAWQIAFALFWLAPSLALSVLLLFPKILTGGGGRAI